MSETLEQRAEAVWRVLRDGTGPLVGESALVNAITAALRRERELAVRECASAAVRKLLEMGFSASVRSAVSEAALEVAKPAAPVWEHRKDCPTPYQLETTTGYWVCHTAADTSARLPVPDWVHFCPGCGSAKPEVQP